MNQTSNPIPLVATDNGTIPGNDVIGDATYVTSGRKVTVTLNTTPLATVLALFEGSMLYSLAENDVRTIKVISIREPIFHLNKAFASDVTTPESLKLIQKFPIKNVGVIFKNAAGIINGVAVPQDTPYNFGFTSRSVTGFAYNNTINSSTMYVTTDQ